MISTLILAAALCGQSHHHQSRGQQLYQNHMTANANQLGELYAHQAGMQSYAHQQQALQQAARAPQVATQSGSPGYWYRSPMAPDAGGASIQLYHYYPRQAPVIASRYNRQP
jgi:hypothetical protein